jgi:hypothetical protein
VIPKRRAIDMRHKRRCQQTGSIDMPQGHVIRPLVSSNWRKDFSSTKHKKSVKDKFLVCFVPQISFGCSTRASLVSSFPTTCSPLGFAPIFQRHESQVKKIVEFNLLFFFFVSLFNLFSSFVRRHQVSKSKRVLEMSTQYVVRETKGYSDMSNPYFHVVCETNGYTIVAVPDPHCFHEDAYFIGSVPTATFLKSPIGEITRKWLAAHSVKSTNWAPNLEKMNELVELLLPTALKNSA